MLHQRYGPVPVTVSTAVGLRDEKGKTARHPGSGNERRTLIFAAVSIEHADNYQGPNRGNASPPIGVEVHTCGTPGNGMGRKPAVRLISRNSANAILGPCAGKGSDAPRCAHSTRRICYLGIAQSCHCTQIMESSSSAPVKPRYLLKTSYRHPAVDHIRPTRDKDACQGKGSRQPD